MVHLTLARWLTVANAARMANVSPDTIYRACALGGLQHVRLNGRRAIRIKPEWVDKWLEAARAAAA